MLGLIPMDFQLYSIEEIIQLIERKVQLVNIPLNYNLKKKQIKKYILLLILEKDLISIEIKGGRKRTQNWSYRT